MASDSVGVGRGGTVPLDVNLLLRSFVIVLGRSVDDQGAGPIAPRHSNEIVFDKVALTCYLTCVGAFKPSAWPGGPPVLGRFARICRFWAGIAEILTCVFGFNPWIWVTCKRSIVYDWATCKRYVLYASPFRYRRSRRRRASNARSGISISLQLIVSPPKEVYGAHGGLGGSAHLVAGR
jgi:hypothetical protein